MNIVNYLKKNFQTVLYAIFGILILYVFGKIPNIYEGLDQYMNWIMVGLILVGIWTVSLKTDLDAETKQQLIRKIKDKYNIAQEEPREEEKVDLGDLEGLE